MALYLRATLRSFVEGLEKTSNLTFPAIELTHLISPEEMDYVLDLLRESIGLYEERKGIPAARSKRKIPFFRQGSRMLVGPELGCYVIPLWERSEEVPASEAPCLLLELDYPSLGELCLWENYSLVACKYDRDAFLKHFAAYWETEYETFFFDEEHTGFTPDSRFFSILNEACLEVRPTSASLSEWRLALTRPIEEANYRYEAGDLLPYVPVALPMECVRRIHLQREQPRLFGTLIGFLKSKGLSAEQLLHLT